MKTYLIVNECDGAIIEYCDNLEETINDAINMASPFARYIVEDNDGNKLYDTNPGVSFKF